LEGTWDFLEILEGPLAHRAGLLVHLVLLVELMKEAFTEIGSPEVSMVMVVDLGAFMEETLMEEVLEASMMAAVDNCNGTKRLREIS
jgi:hypothetical protein